MDLFMRKVISFGKNSHIITLPKEWVVKNKVSQGDVVSLKDNGDGLIVQAHLQPVKSPEKYLTINVDGKGLKKIKAEIFSAYLCNASTMEIIGNGLSTLAEEIKGIIHSLAGLEVLEQTSTKLVAKDLINVQEISLKATIRRMDIITKSMIEDLFLCAQSCGVEAKSPGPLAENLEQRDKEVNRLYYLALRVISGALNEPSSMQELKLTPLALHHCYLIIVRLERIADQAKGIVADLPVACFSGRAKQDFLELLKLLFERYNDTLKAYYTGNRESALDIEVSGDAVIERLIKFLDSFTRDCIGGRKGKGKKGDITYPCMAATRIIDGMKVMAKYTGYIARVVISES